MEKKRFLGAAAAGGFAGILNGLFGGGGGMLLIPMLGKYAQVEDTAIFPTSVSVMLPVSLLSLTLANQILPWPEATPYLIGSVIGGILVGLFGKKIPAVWLHRLLGGLILWGGIRYLW